MSAQGRIGRSPREIVATIVVLVVIGLAVAANATVGTARANAPAAQKQLITAISMSSGASSVAWYCPGPLPAGKRSQTSSIAVANIGLSPIQGEIVIALSSGISSTQSFTVKAAAQILVPLKQTGPAVFAAVTVLADGTSLGVAELVHSAVGPLASTCVSHASNATYLAPGSSLGANNVTLSLFDPGATPAVANVVFAVGSLSVAPPAFQGITIPAGGLVALDVGHYLPERRVFSTLVSSSGGRIVAGSLAAAAIPNQPVVYSLLAASPASLSSWYFAPSPSGPGVRDVISVLNPGTSVARVGLRLNGPQGSGEQTVDVGPGTVAHVSEASDAGAASLRYLGVQNTTDDPIVVGRETYVDQPTAGAPIPVLSVTSPQHDVKAADLARLPRLPPGYASSAPVADPAMQWLIPGGASDREDGEAILIANTSSHQTNAEIETMSGPLGTGGFPVLAQVVIAAHSSVAVSLADVAGIAHSLPIVVDASNPVIAAGLLYASGLKGSVGFSEEVGIPVD